MTRRGVTLPAYWEERMAFVVGENSYLSVEAASDYFALRLYAEPWTGAALAQKQAALVMATFTIDRMARWYGEPTSAEQKLCFPRTGIFDRNGNPIAADAIPQDIQDAVCEQALAFLQMNTTRMPESIVKGITSAHVGSLSVTYASMKEFSQAKVCNAAYDILLASCLGDVIANGDATIRNVGISR